MNVEDLAQSVARKRETAQRLYREMLEIAADGGPLPDDAEARLSDLGITGQRFKGEVFAVRARRRYRVDYDSAEQLQKNQFPEADCAVKLRATELLEFRQLGDALLRTVVVATEKHLADARNWRDVVRGMIETRQRRYWQNAARLDEELKQLRTASEDGEQLVTARIVKLAGEPIDSVPSPPAPPIEKSIVQVAARAVQAILESLPNAQRESIRAAFAGAGATKEETQQP